jgi:YbbR domain-containing protein
METRRTMKKLYNSRAFWMIVSLFASLILWIYVSSVDQEAMQITLRGVKVELVGEEVLRNSRNMVVTDMDTSTVTVVLEGPRRIIGSWDSDSITAQIDVSKLTTSAYTSQQFVISYPDGTDTSSISVIRKTPDTINFMVSQQVSKTIQVRGSFDGQLADGYTAEMPVFEPSTITITGAETYIKDVSYAWVTFGEGEVDSTYKVETGFTLMDEDGIACSTTGINFSTDVVTATLPVLDLKEVKLDVNLIEGAGATAANTKVTIEPSSLLLAGDSSLLEGLNRIVLDTIDLTDFESTFSDVYTIPLDNGLRNTTGETEAKVTVEISGLTSKSFKVTNLSYINNSDGYSADIVSQSIDVVLRGKEEVISQLKADNIRAVADLVNLKESTGTYMVPVKIYIDGFTDVGALGENSISIEIRKVN